jgi:hypothetical protein
MCVHNGLLKSTRNKPHHDRLAWLSELFLNLALVTLLFERDTKDFQVTESGRGKLKFLRSQEENGV